jgi:hypothetical protein
VILRPLTPDDAPWLAAHQRGYPYPSAGFIASSVVADAAGEPLMIAAVVVQPQAYLWVGECGPAVKLQALRLLHAELARQLRELGFNECDCELPPGVLLQGRLKRMGWIRNTWEKWFVRF